MTEQEQAARAKLQSTIQQCATTFLRQVSSTVPPDAECRDAFEQFAGAVAVAVKYPGEEEAGKFAYASFCDLYVILTTNRALHQLGKQPPETPIL